MANDWNQQIIDEFRANHGVVGGPFAGHPMVLLHHVGRKSGKEYVTPLVYLPGDSDSVSYIFASAAGAAAHPQWYSNITDAGEAAVEVGDSTYTTTVSEVTGPERDRIYAAQVKEMPGFAGYEEKTAGIRTIPVIRLQKH